MKKTLIAVLAALVLSACNDDGPVHTKCKQADGTYNQCQPKQNVIDRMLGV